MNRYGSLRKEQSKKSLTRKKCETAKSEKHGKDETGLLVGFLGLSTYMGKTKEKKLTNGLYIFFKEWGKSKTQVLGGLKTREGEA